MGQEQSYAHASATQRRYRDNTYEEPAKYRRHTTAVDIRDNDTHYKRHRPRRSAESFNSDQSQHSSGYRSGSNYDYQSNYESERSNTTDYCRLSLYKNDHYKDLSKELYKPVKLPKEKRYKQLTDIEREGKARIQSYLNDTEKALKHAPKKVGIRNYTPKILEDEQTKGVDNWV